MTLAREQMLAADDRRFEQVEVPEWGGSVRVGSMMASDLFRYFELSRGASDGSPIPAALQLFVVSACVVDDQGVPVFTPADVEALGRKSAAVMLRLYAKCAELSGLSDNAKEVAKGE